MLKLATVLSPMKAGKNLTDELFYLRKISELQYFLVKYMYIVTGISIVQKSIDAINSHKNLLRKSLSIYGSSQTSIRRHNNVYNLYLVCTQQAYIMHALFRQLLSWIHCCIKIGALIFVNVIGEFINKFKIYLWIKVQYIIKHLHNCSQQIRMETPSINTRVFARRLSGGAAPLALSLLFLICTTGVQVHVR